MNASCQAMVELSSSIFLKISLTYNLLIALIGIYVFSWASIKLWTSVYCLTFHTNLRMVCQMHLSGFLLHCYGRVVLHSMDLYNYHFRQPCDMIPNVYRCFIFRLLYNTGMWITTCTAIPMIMESLAATIGRAKYEKWPISFGIFLSVSQVLLAAVPLSLAYSNTKFDGVFMAYCSVYKLGFPEIAKINGYVSVGAQIVARVVFGILFFLNKRYRDSLDGKTLSARFQIEQNKSSMQCLKIYANLSTTFLFLQTGSFMYLLEAGLPQKDYLPWMEFNCQYPLYGIITVLLVARKIKSMRQKVHDEMVNNSDLNFDDYHKGLQQLFNQDKSKIGMYAKF